MIKLHFLGANRQVTGSRYCLETEDRTVLIDCGLFQEREFLGRNWEPNPIAPNKLDAVLVTHAHIDHCGLVPKLVRDGYRGSVYCTPPTKALADIILNDSAEIQEEDAAFKKKRHAREGRRGKYPEVPLYTVKDAQRCLRHWKKVDYGHALELGPNLTATFFDAGHILGSAMIRFDVATDDGTVQVLFSGDVGQWNKPLIRDPTLFDAADYVVMESTYGDRDHERNGDVATQLATVIDRTIRRGGNVVIPTFAVERAQELIYHLGRLLHEDRIPDVPVFLDSPMAVDVTDVFRQFRGYLDEETWNLINSHQPPLRYPALHLVRSRQDSKAINEMRQPCVIMASSGMCTAGRIKHHLAQNIERSECTILFVGYQAHGTLGRQILDGNAEVRIHGRMRRVLAETAQIHGFSGHADRQTLLRWIGHISKGPRHVFLTHGEQAASEQLANEIRGTFGWSVSVPEYQDSVIVNEME